ncbi:hypothetical protein K1719_041789 [Acacia pycnantha]|nr:hypothetical protein K1719_041789 [Acacia pycnantha]
MDLCGNNQWLPSTPVKSIAPSSHICDEFLVSSTPLGGDNDVATKQFSFAGSVPNEESETTNDAASLFQSCDLNGKSSFGISTPGNIPLRPNSHINAEPRKAAGQKKKKKVYWPKVKGQIKRKTTPKVPKESKTKRGHVSKVNGDNRKYNRTSESKSSASLVDENKFDSETRLTDRLEVQHELLSTLKGHIISANKGPLYSKRESSRRSLTFEPEGNFEKPLHVQDELNELGFKGDSLRETCERSLIFETEENLKPIHAQDESLGFKGDSLRILKKKLPQKRINLSCPLLIRIRRMKLKIPRQKRSKSQKKRIIKREELPFQWNKKRKRSCRTGKRMKKVEPANFTEDIVPKQEFGKWEIREGRKALYIMSNFVEHQLDRDENKTNDERKGKTRRKMTISNKGMKDLIKKFQSFNLTSYKNQDRRLVLHKSQDIYKGKVKLDLKTLNEWHLVMHGKSYEQNDINREYWKQERLIFSKRVGAFIACMHNFLGNRSFSPWKGSALDSVIGVFLTQNVSDHLSSSAYMSLASTFPIKTSSEEGKNNIAILKHENSSKTTNNNNLYLGKGKLFSPGMVFGKKKSIFTRKKVDQTEQERKIKEEQEDEEQDKQYWESLRREYIQHCSPRNSSHTDSADWEAMRRADVNKVAKAIEGRGQHNIIAQRIQALLNKLVEMHGSIDLEWLRHAPPNKVKEYLLKVYGLGLKSVECIRLLALEHVAFPVDVNVGRIVVRLGWVPLEPLPGSIELHMLDQYPLLDVVQQYLWPRLCTMDQSTLYQLHYHLITFGKVFCTKKQPNCQACPMRGEFPYNQNMASKFMPEVKSVARLRTKRMVYVLPDTHPLLKEFPERELGDPSNYLLVMWIQGELEEEPCEAAQNQSPCSNNNGFSCNKIKEEGNPTVSGTILVPCRTATNGRFPLNGTYFQVNEVFADADSSQHPIDVPTSMLWNLDTRIAYFGTSTSNIIRNSSLEEIQECFWKGFVCVRGWDRKTGAARPLSYRFHCKTADQLIMNQKRRKDDQDLKDLDNQYELGPQRDELRTS